METVLSRTFTAGADLSSYQYRYVYLSSENTVTFTGAGGTPIGILQNAPEEGYDAEVMLYGISRLSMSATCSVMAKIGSAASGQGVAVTADEGVYGAIAIQDCGNANEQIRVWLVGPQTISTS